MKAKVGSSVQVFFLFEAEEDARLAAEAAEAGVHRLLMTFWTSQSREVESQRVSTRLKARRKQRQPQQPWRRRAEVRFTSDSAKLQGIEWKKRASTQICSRFAGLLGLWSVTYTGAA